MHKLTLVLFLLGAICEQNFSDYRNAFREFKNEDNVVVLDKENLKTVLKKVDRVLVEFYAPWCKHCKELAPLYSSIASTLQTQEKKILVTKINAHEEKEIASEYNIKGYPTLILFNQGQQEKYEGPLKEKDILKWINRKLSRKAREIFTKEEFQKMQKKKLSILYTFPSENQQALRRVQQVAQYFDMLPFFYTNDKELKKEADCQEQYCLFVYRNFDDGLRAMKNKDQFSVQTMIQFIDNLRYPYVEEINDEVLQRYIHRSDSVMVYFGDDLEKEEYKTFTNFARQNSKFIKFAVNQYQSELNDMIANFSDVKTEDLPTVRILKLSPHNIEKYKIEKISNESLREALEGFNKNSLDALYKSEDIPSQNDDLIKKLVGKNFEEIVQNSKFVFLDMYAPECEECMELQDIYKQLAGEYKQNQEVEFYQIDVSKNEHPDLKIKGLPTFRLYKPNQKKHKEYDGPRTYEEIKAFIDIELNEEDIDTDI